MKHFNILWFMSALVLTISCEKPGTDTECNYDSDFTAGQFYGLYYGTEYAPGLANYFFYLTDEGGIIDGKRQPDCTFYEIDLFSPSVIGTDEPIVLPTGSFNMSAEPTDNSFSGAFYTTTVSDGNGIGITDIASIKTGSLSIVQKDGQYTIELTVTLESEDESIDGKTHRVTYTGPAPFTDMRQPGLPSLVETEFVSAEVTYYTPDSEIGWGFDQIYIRFSDMTGTGQWPGYEAYVVLNTTPLSADANTVPAGSYQMTTSGSVPGTFNPGMVNPITGTPTGTYVVSYDKNDSQTVVMTTGGNITISEESGISTFQLDLRLGESTFKATYTGTLNISK